VKVSSLLLSVLIALFMVVFFIHCTEKYPSDSRKFGLAKRDGCIDCHGNAGLLKKVATPLPPKDGESGEG